MFIWQHLAPRKPVGSTLLGGSRKDLNMCGDALPAFAPAFQHMNAPRLFDLVHPTFLLAVETASEADVPRAVPSAR